MKCLFATFVAGRAAGLSHWKLFLYKKYIFACVEHGMGVHKKEKYSKERDVILFFQPGYELSLDSEETLTYIWTKIGVESQLSAFNVESDCVWNVRTEKEFLILLDKRKL